MEELMRKLTLILAAAGCVGLVTPAFAAEKTHALGQRGMQIGTDANAKAAPDEVSSQSKKKKKKKGTTSRSSWGG
jgi:hypothetical protein